MAYKALHGLALPSFASPSPVTTLYLTNCALVVLTFVCLEQTKLIPTTGPLHSLCLLPGIQLP